MRSLQIHGDRVDGGKLLKILLNFAETNAEVQYCQGINYIGGNFLMKFEGDETKTLECLIYFMKKYF